MLLGAGMVTIPRQILISEQQRSLGNGSLATLVFSNSETIAARSALAIGRTKQVSGIPLLERNLRTPRDGVRAMSVFGLGLIGAGSDSAAISAMAARDPSSAVRLGAVDALGRYEAGKRLKTAELSAASALGAVLARDPDPIVRGRAAISLSYFADGKAGKPASSALAAAIDRDTSAAVRERIMWTIFRRYAAMVPRTVLARHLHDSDEIVRIEAVRAYGRLKERSAIADVRPLLTDPSWRVAEQAAESIRALEGQKPTEHLTAIPSTVHTPAPVTDSLASLPALGPVVAEKPSAPQAMEAIIVPEIDPHTAADMTGPAHGAHPRVRIVTTRGNIYVVLYPEWAPMTVTNFLNLARDGFYSDNPWFRIVPDFVVQTGERDAKKAPGPGYTIGAEENPVEQSSNIISMGLDYDTKTNTPKRDSAGSEYYITLSPQYHLDNDFSVFGAVTGGSDVLGRLIESDKVVRIERIADVDL